MKAILVIDELPKSCYECPLSHSEAGFFGDICDSVCTVLDRTNIVFMDGTGRPSWCPLRPLPSKRRKPFTKTFGTPYNIGKAEGWNRCLDEILGETNG